MKIFLALLLSCSIPLLLSTSSRNDRICVYSNYALCVYLEENNCEFILNTNNGFYSKYARFDANRTLACSNNILLVPGNDLSQYLGVLLSDVLLQFGPVHFDMGSGFCLPTYISDDAHFITFLSDENGVVYDVVKYDPVSSKTGDGLREP